MVLLEKSKIFYLLIRPYFLKFSYRIWFAA